MRLILTGCLINEAMRRAQLNLIHIGTVPRNGKLASLLIIRTGFQAAVV